MCIRKSRVVFPRYPLLNYPPTTFLHSLFSYRYKSLFPQPFSFHIHTKPQRVGALSRHSSLATRHFPFIFINLPPLWRLQNSQPLCNQANPDSFAKTPGVGGTSAISVLRCQCLCCASSCISRVVSSLPPLGFSWLSFSHSPRLFSATCNLLSQIQGVGMVDSD